MRQNGARLASPELAPTPNAGNGASIMAEGVLREANRRWSEATIRLRAYEKWEAAGRPSGDGAEFWLDAERELRQHNQLVPRPASRDPLGVRHRCRRLRHR